MIKKSVLIVLIALLLCACSPIDEVETPSVSNCEIAPRTEALVEPSAPPATAVELPDYFPSVGFEIDTVWESEEFGKISKAVLNMAHIEDCSFRLSFFPASMCFAATTLAEFIAKL